jgi:two-component system, sensor histidine kinase YesM
LHTTHIQSVIVRSPYDSYYLPINTTLAGNSLAELEKYDNRYYQKIKKESGHLTIFNTEPVEFTLYKTVNCFIIGRLVQDTKMNALGYILILVKDDFFKELTENLRFGTNSAFYILSKDNSIIYSQVSNPQYHDYLQSIKGRILNGENSFTIKNSAGAVFHITSYSSTYSGWTLVNIVPMSYMLSGMNFNRNIIIIFCTVFVLFTIIPAASISNSINKPVKNLIQTMRKISIGNLSLRVQVDNGFETKELCNHFNKMIDEINILIRENEDKQKALVKTELSMLQAQINPHFLYNTLNSIRWVAIINGQDQIKNLIDSLSKLLMNSLKKNDELITIENELSILQSYITLMKVRYKNFHVKYDTAEIQMSYKVLKFVLQPFIENSIIYAFNNINYLGVITISFEKQPDFINIKVADNGSGIHHEEKERILAFTDPQKNQFSNIGIFNVHKRIQLHYGDNFGIRIHDNKPAGTIIEIKLPIIE